MEHVVANVDHITFDVETMIDNQTGIMSLPFNSMDKSNSSVCLLFKKGQCRRGDFCPYRHIVANSNVVCKHFMRGLCKKGDGCNYLHELNTDRMPECFFFSKYNSCSNKDCPFNHTNPEDVKECPWYNRGMCRHGMNCKNRHVRRTACERYIAGFCHLGPECDKTHPAWALHTDNPTKGPGGEGTQAFIATNASSSNTVKVCSRCHSTQHRIYNCPTLLADSEHYNDNHTRTQRPLSEVTCFKCQQRGHYANKCPMSNNFSRALLGQ